MGKFDKEEKMLYEVLDECPEETIFDSYNNSILALRNIAWNNRASKLELRKWFINDKGEEIPAKGFSFLTNDGPNQLTHLLLKMGYGDNDTINDIMKNRKNDKKEISNEYTKSSYSAKALLNNIIGSSDDE